MHDVLLFIGVSPYCVVRNCSDADISYLLDNYGFCLSRIETFDSIDDLKKSDFVECDFDG